VQALPAVMTAAVDTTSRKALCGKFEKSDAHGAGTIDGHFGSLSSSPSCLKASRRLFYAN